MHRFDTNVVTRSHLEAAKGTEKIRISNFSKTFTIRRGFTRRCTCWSRVEESMTNLLLIWTCKIDLTDREKGNFGKVFKKTNFRNRIILISWRKVKSIAEFN